MGYRLEAMSGPQMCQSGLVEGPQWARPAVGGHEPGHEEGSCQGHWLPSSKCRGSEEAALPEKKAFGQLHEDVS